VDLSSSAVELFASPEQMICLKKYDIPSSGIYRPWYQEVELQQWPSQLHDMTSGS